MGRAAKWIYGHTPRRAADAGLLVLAAMLRLLIRWVWPDRGVVLCYHVVEDRHGLPGPALVPTIAPARFEAQLRHLARAYRPVPSARLPGELAGARRGGRNPVAITFDDDHPSYLRTTAPILRSLGLPGTFFLSGNALDEPHEFWWQTLQRAVDTRGLEAVEQELGKPLAAIVLELETMAPGAREAAAAALLPEAERPAPATAGVRRGELPALTGGGLAVGFHTRDHRSLPALDDAELADAMTCGREELERAAGQPLRELAYPYGHHDDRVVRAAAAAGYEMAYTVRPRAATAASPRLQIGRLEAGDAHAGRFAWLVVKTLLAAS